MLQFMATPAQRLYFPIVSPMSVMTLISQFFFITDYLLLQIPKHNVLIIYADMNEKYVLYSRIHIHIQIYAEHNQQ